MGTPVNAVKGHERDELMPTVFRTVRFNDPNTASIIIALIPDQHVIHVYLRVRTYRPGHEHYRLLTVSVVQLFSRISG